MHAAAAFPLTCSSQVKVATWLQSSEDMDRCSKGERPELSRDFCSVCEAYFCPNFINTCVTDLSLVVK